MTTDKTYALSMYMYVYRYMYTVHVHTVDRINLSEVATVSFRLQDLTVTVAADRPHTEVELVEDIDEPSSINTRSFVDEQEWR